MRRHKSKTYNWVFNPNNGFFVRWGKTLDDDPEFSPIGPEILDIEVSTICHKACSWCYKSNTAKGKNMSFDTFKEILDKIPDNLTQVAFGVGDIDANPDLWKMMDYCREKNVVPNITINGEGIDSEIASRLSVCGAIAVSHYDNEKCFNTINLLKDAGCKQINIHKLLSNETFLNTLSLLSDYRLGILPKVNSIVLLSLKPIGNRNTMTQIDYNNFKVIVEYGMKHNIPLGFDSCSANNFLKVVEGSPSYPIYETLAEPCESTLFSMYVNVEGKAFPCSFTEFGEGLEITNNFEDVWFSDLFKDFRKKLFLCKRSCPVY